jgi:hypothetical protein
MTGKQMWLVLAALIVFLLGYFFVGMSKVDPETVYGVTWSPVYAEQLGIDNLRGLEAVLDELKVRHVRIPSYWNRLEPVQGQVHFEELDKELDVIAKRGGKAIVVVGATQPRWPECWVPSWAANLPQADREAAQLAHVRAVVGRYATHPAVEKWQVENEPTLIAFGECKDQRKEFLEQEMEEVRSLELQMLPEAKRHPVVTTDSGELSTWLGFRNFVDAKGFSVYRVVLTPWGNVWRYWFIPPFFYDRKVALLRPFIQEFFVSEFQMEPWANAPLPTINVEDQFKIFGIGDFREHLAFAERMGMPRVYFWGVEWWYWMKEQKRHPEFWDEAVQFFSTRRRE